MASAEDPLIDEVATLLGLLSKDLAIVLLTARPARTAQPRSGGWAGTNCAGTSWSCAATAITARRHFKQEAVRNMGAHGFDVKLCVEDDLRNVEMFRAEGLTALYIHSGYSER